MQKAFGEAKLRDVLKLWELDLTFLVALPLIPALKELHLCHQINISQPV